MLDALSAPLLAARTAELDAAAKVTYRLEQTFRYSYDAPVDDLRHRLVVMPPARHGDVHRRLATLTVSGVPARRHRRTDRRDRWGNETTDVHAPRVTDHVEFRLAAVLERVVGSGAVELPWARLRDARLLTATPLTAPDAAIVELAESLRRPENPLETAERVCSAVHAASPTATGRRRPAPPPPRRSAGGVGVCQDYAHVMIAVMRHLGIPTRYVSGHLIGQGGTHAWVDVVVPGNRADGGLGAVAVAFDPCNDKRAGAGHLTVAVGRDYTDVAPTSGSFSGPGVRGTLTSTRDLGVVSLSV
ncbi:transglutaminase family protein [Quadrisphaera sp. INWT6]|uniref:transglutaminase domain-containing protein n=1 Tax=Quadrisphaera sp. INWT6 TaxID=2596917 RepID=UPI0018921EDC|nr:transglutaminase family protein [Quadrisphaera sp. INWT6]MBF5081786.1 transglutaminase family protein [Quadrisphaera sp. INWT6]